MRLPPCECGNCEVQSEIRAGTHIGMGRKGTLKEYPFVRQAFHGWRLAKGIAVEVTRGGFLLVCHNHQDIRSIGHFALTPIMVSHTRSKGDNFLWCGFSGLCFYGSGYPIFCRAQNMLSPPKQFLLSVYY